MPDTVLRKWISQSMNGQTIQVFGGGGRNKILCRSDLKFFQCVEIKDKVF